MSPPISPSRPSPPRAPADAAPGAPPRPDLAPPRADADADDRLGRGLGLVLAAAEVRLIDGLGLAARPGPPALACLRGQVRGQGLTMRTRGYAGGGLDRLVIAAIEVDGVGLRSATLIGFPAPATGLPVLAIDLIALAGGLSLAAIDLAPVDDARWEADAAPLLRTCRAWVEGRVVHRRWPDFARDVFSPLALIAGARAGDEGAVFAAAVGVIAGYAELAVWAAAAPAADPAVIAARAGRLAAWRAAERRNRREHDALARLFGAEVAGRYLADLFGEGDDA